MTYTVCIADNTETVVVPAETYRAVALLLCQVLLLTAVQLLSTALMLIIAPAQLTLCQEGASAFAV
jgi:hypothetical protein